MSKDPLRPLSLEDFTGQDVVKAQLSTIFGGARHRGTDEVPELPPHLLFTGPPGLGKTTLAMIVASEFNLKLVPVLGATVKQPNELTSILSRLQARSVLFIDEVHRLPAAVEEVLYTALEDQRVDLMVGSGSTAQVIPLAVKPFVLIGATTLAGSLSAPLRDRFGYTARLKPYEVDTLTGIVERAAELLDVRFGDSEAAALIASRSRGTPRVANNLLKRVRDHVHATGAEEVTAANAAEGLRLFGIDELGLTEFDREVLTALCTKYSGRPVGVESLASSLGETASSVATVSEPYLIELGLMVRTPQGRVAMPSAFEHLGLTVPRHLLGSLDFEVAANG